MTTVAAIEILTSPIALMLIGYALVQVVATALVDPVRHRMVANAEAMLAEERWSEQQREEINILLDASMAFRVGFIIWLGVLSLTVDIALRRTTKPETWQRELMDDERFDALLHDFAISSAAANPFAAVGTAFLMGCALILAAIVQRLPSRQIINEVVEEPMLRALESVNTLRAPA